MPSLSNWLDTSLLLGLRIAPAFAFAPPFTMFQFPASFRVLFGLGLAAVMASTHPDLTYSFGDNAGVFVAAAMHELGVGLVVVLAFQLAFGALYWAGRTIDIQAGFGLATLIDPASQAQMPLVGSLFAYVAGAVFFAIGGHVELLRLLSASLDAIPLGTWTMPHSVARLTTFMSVTLAGAFGIAASAILVLFLIDSCIAMLSRTVPQMNVLILGFQVKTIALLLVLPACFSLDGVLFIRLMATTLQAVPRLF